MKIALHSCGAVSPLIQDLLEAGFDILNPVQPLAKGMDHKEIKSKYGDQICFHGGVDIQEIIPNGTPVQVQNEVQRVTNQLGSGSTGYIIATAHNILADVPPQNVQSYVQSERNPT